VLLYSALIRRSLERIIILSGYSSR
jgi:hypothetical protein